MPEEAEPETSLDFNALAEAIDQFREMTRAMQAGIVADGYSQQEARAIVAGFFASQVSRIADDEEEQ